MTEVKNLVLAIATVAGSNGLPVTEIDKIVNDWLKEGYTVFSCNTAGVIGATVVIHILLVK